MQLTTKPVGSCTIITQNWTEYRQHIHCLIQMLNLAVWHKKWHWSRGRNHFKLQLSKHVWDVFECLHTYSGRET